MIEKTNGMKPDRFPETNRTNIRQSGKWRE